MKVVFMGTPDFAVPTLSECVAQFDVVGVVTQPDRRRGRGQRMVPTPVKQVALENNISVLQPRNVNTSQAIEWLKDKQPDVYVVVAYGQILKASVLSIPSYGAINVHASLLPKLRGGAPIHWAILRGHEKTGVTTMLMDKGLDTGDMLLKSVTSIGVNETVGQLHDRLAQMGAVLLKRTLLEVEQGRLESQPQNHKEATYAPNLSKQDRLIRWNAAAMQVHNQIRGLNPWPTAYTSFAGRQLIVLRSKVIKRGFDADPGTIVDITDDGFVVACSEGALHITQVRPQSRSQISGDDFVRGYHVEIGHRLGQ